MHTKAAARLSVLTFNTGLIDLQVAGRKLSLVRHAARRREAIPAGIARLGADVVALQEVADPADRRRLIAELNPAYPYSTGDVRGTCATGRGLLLLSRYPMAGCRAGEDGLPMLEATVQVPGAGPLVVVTTHVPPRLLPLLSSRARQRVASALIARLSPRRAIVAGDFNAGPEVDARFFGRFLGAGFADLLGRCSASAAVPTWGRDNPLVRAGAFPWARAQRIDHVMASPVLAGLHSVFARRVLDQATISADDGKPIPLSDHYGVMVCLDLHYRTPRTSGAVAGSRHQLLETI